MSLVTPLNTRLPAVKRRYPRVLLIAPRDDERRRAMLLLTSQRFVVDDCKAASQAIGMWEYATKYDAVLVLPDAELDPNGAFAIQDIRRKEIEPSRQQQSEAVVNLHTRLNEHAGKHLAPHRAQRFAEQQQHKQQILQALERVRVSAGSADRGSAGAALAHGTFASDILHRTFVIGFDANQHEQYMAMEVSGNYDYILHGMPSDPHNVSSLALLFQVQYPITKYEAVPSFEVVVRSLREFEGARRGSGSETVDRSARQQQHQGSSVRSDEAAGAPLSSHRTAFNPGAAGSAHHGDGASAAVSLSVSHDALHAAHFHAQLHEAEVEITELVAARDAAESELQKSQMECQRLRSALKEAAERVEVLTDVKQSLAEQLQSRTAEIASMQREFDTQLRCIGREGVGTQSQRQTRRSSSAVAGTPAAAAADDRAVSGAVGDSDGTSATAVESSTTRRSSSVMPARGELSGLDAKATTSAFEEMRAQQQRLRDLVFRYETALHELAIHNRMLQRRLDAVTLVGGGSPRGGSHKRRRHDSRGRRRSSVALLAETALEETAASNASAPRRHPSLAKLSLPSADEMFRPTASATLSSTSTENISGGNVRGAGADSIPGELNEEDPLSVVSGGSSSSSDSSASDANSDGGGGGDAAKDEPEAAESRRRKSFLRQSLRDLRVPRRLSVLAQRASRTSEKLSQAQGRNEQYEAALMFMHDRESHQREALDATVEMLMSEAAAETLTATRFSSRSIPLANNSLIASWSAIEAELQATAKSLDASLQAIAPPPSGMPLNRAKGRGGRLRTGSAGRRAKSEEQQEALRVRAMLEENHVSTLAALELLPVVRDALDPVVGALEQDFSSFQNLVMQALSSVAGSYESLMVATRRCPKLQHLARPTSTSPHATSLGAAAATDARTSAGERLMRVTSKVSPSTLPQAPLPPSPPDASPTVSLVNLMLLQQTSIFKKCLANLRRARAAHEHDLQSLLSSSLGVVATAFTPLKAAILAARSRGEMKPVFDANTQTENSGGGAAHHHRTSISQQHPMHARRLQRDETMTTVVAAPVDPVLDESDAGVAAAPSFVGHPTKPISRNGSSRFRATQFCD